MDDELPRAISRSEPLNLGTCSRLQDITNLPRHDYENLKYTEFGYHSNYILAIRYPSPFHVGFI